MARYRHNLPQLDGKRFLTDGGIETTLIFQEGLDLPEFAAFVLLQDEAGRAALRKYFRAYAKLARQYGIGLILESATWRASRDWGARLGYTAAELVELNQRAIVLLEDIRAEYEMDVAPIVISGCIGPRGDGYIPSSVMTADEAAQYHTLQIEAFDRAGVDLVTAMTMNYVEEAIGIARAAKAANLPVVISFTVETDGRLPTGQSLQEAIEQVNQATQHAPAYFMVNCAHPEHFDDVLATGSAWTDHIRGVRANASTKSHAELNESTELDEGRPHEFGRQHHTVFGSLKNLTIIGGCCGTDHRHVASLCESWRVAA